MKTVTQKSKRVSCRLVGDEADEVQSTMKVYRFVQFNSRERNDSLKKGMSSQWGNLA
jgi:hypothetical protein